MIVERRKSALKNIKWGLLKIFVIQLLPFIIRTVMINTLGVEYLGLNSIFAAIISVLNLGELGFGSAFVYALYKPVSEDNQGEICQLLTFYRKVYRIIGVSIFFVGLLFLPFLNVIISKECPSDINMYILYLIVLSDTAFSYLFSAYKQSLLLAHQRSDIESKFLISINIIMYFFQIIILLFIKSYYIFIITKPMFTIFNNIFISLITKKLYPNLVCCGTINSNLKRDLLSRVGALAGHKIGTTVINSSDSLVISTFLGLTITAIYSNYYMIMNAIIKVMSILVSSTIAGVGNCLVTKDKNENYNLFLVINFGIIFLVTISSACFLNLYQPFMRLWMGEKMLLPWNSIILLVVYYYTWQVRVGVTLFKDAAGLWKADKWKPYVSSIINLTMNILLVNRIGLNGVFISTIICMVFINAPWETYALFTNIFEISIKHFYKKKIYEYIVVCVVLFISFITCQIVIVNNSIIELILKLIVCVISSTLTFIFLNYRNDDFKRFVEFLKESL